MMAPVLFGAVFSLTGCAAAHAPQTAQAGEATQVANLGPAPATEQAARLADVPVVAPYVAPVVPANARQAVVDAYEAQRSRRWADLDALVPTAGADPVLGQYPAYWSLRRQLQDRTQSVPDAEVRQFLQADPDAYLANEIRDEWILSSVRAGDYAKALQIEPGRDSSSRVQCARLMARHLDGKRARASEFLDIYQPNSDCWDLLAQLSADHVLSRQQLNGLLRDTLESGNTSRASRVVAAVFDTAGVAQYAALMKNPRKWLEAHAKPASATDFELTTLALSRLARSDDRDQAARYIRDNWAGRLPKSDLQWVWGQFGLAAALNQDPQAVNWYRESGFGPMTDYNHAWQVRAELRMSPVQWPQVAQAIRKMTARQADEPVWRYWYGRALAAEGNTKAARQYYESIATDLGFYGQLACEELGRTPYMPPEPIALDRAWVAQARANPGLERAVALFDLGWRREAVGEWNFALHGMSDPQLRGAAEFAREQGIYDRVVNTSLRTSDVVDFSQRFVAPFEGRVAAKAQMVGLDPAWIYGLIRQESRFITDIRSHAGASGLMQLMPATAKWVARKIGMTDFKPGDVNDFDTNTVLGTNYLSMVLRDLGGSELLATAGYNAGPGRPKRWRAQLAAPVEGAIFAETIPFTETRLYVKNVMSNAVYYSMLFSGEPSSLKALLGTVSPVGDTKTALP